MSGTERYLSAREAADYCGCSERAVRKWIAQGKLVAIKRGGTFRIATADLEPFRRNPGRNAAEQTAPSERSADRNGTEQAERSDRSADQGAAAELGRLVRDQQQTIMELAGRVGFLQSELQATQEQLRALQAGTVAPDSDGAGQQAASSAEGLSEGTQAPPRRWWWPW